MNKARILVIEDNRYLVQVYERLLEMQGYVVFTAFDGEEGLQKAQKVKPDLIILDILMPGKNGWEIMEELKDDPETQSIPVIISTVKNRPEDIERGKDLRAADHIAKPYVFSDLLEKIRAITGTG